VVGARQIIETDEAVSYNYAHGFSVSRIMPRMVQKVLAFADEVLHRGVIEELPFPKRLQKEKTSRRRSAPACPPGTISRPCAWLFLTLPLPTRTLDMTSKSSVRQPCTEQALVRDKLFRMSPNLVSAPPLSRR
jgi:hypothetical protein